MFLAEWNILLSLLPNGQALYSQETLKEKHWDFFKFEHSLYRSINFSLGKLRRVKRHLVTFQKGMLCLEHKLYWSTWLKDLAFAIFFFTLKLTNSAQLQWYLDSTYQNPLTWPSYSMLCVSVWWVTSPNNTKGKQKHLKETLQLKHFQFRVIMNKSLIPWTANHAQPHDQGRIWQQWKVEYSSQGVAANRNSNHFKAL